MRWRLSSCWGLTVGRRASQEERRIGTAAAFFAIQVRPAPGRTPHRPSAPPEAVFPPRARRSGSWSRRPRARAVLMCGAEDPVRPDRSRLCHAGVSGSEDHQILMWGMGGCRSRSSARYSSSVSARRSHATTPSGVPWPAAPAKGAPDWMPPQNWGCKSRAFLDFAWLPP